MTNFTWKKSFDSFYILTLTFYHTCHESEHIFTESWTCELNGIGACGPCRGLGLIGAAGVVGCSTAVYRKALAGAGEVPPLDWLSVLNSMSGSMHFSINHLDLAQKPMATHAPGPSRQPTEHEPPSLAWCTCFTLVARPTSIPRGNSVIP